MPVTYKLIRYSLNDQNGVTAIDYIALADGAVFSGAYADLTGKPTLGSAAATASSDYATAGQGATADSALQPAGNGSALTGLTKAQVGLGSVTDTADSDKPVSTAQQTALNLKANIASPTFTGTVGGITATMVGLGNVNNTSDANKPVSTAQQTALDLKEDEANKGAANGYAPLGADSKVPLVNIPIGIGVGDVIGPVSAADNRVVFFDGITGKIIKDSGLTLSGGNTGDQTSIVGISGTLAQFNTALSDANFASGGGTATGTNTGDDATNSQYSGLDASKQATLVSGTNIKTINGSTVLGAGDLVVAASDLSSILTTSSTISAGKQRVMAQLSIADGGGILVIEDGGILAMA